MVGLQSFADSCTSQQRDLEASCICTEDVYASILIELCRESSISRKTVSNSSLSTWTRQDGCLRKLRRILQCAARFGPALTKRLMNWMKESASSGCLHSNPWPFGLPVMVRGSSWTQSLASWMRQPKRSPAKSKAFGRRCVPGAHEAETAHGILRSARAPLGPPWLRNSGGPSCCRA